MKKIILVYHGIGNQDKFMEVSLDMFKKQLGYLKKQKFKFCHFDDLVTSKFGNNVMIMFDDALSSSKEALKYLEENKIKYSLAIIENNLNKAGFLKEFELKKLKYAKFYFHTQNHVDLSSLSKEEIKKELTITKPYVSKEVLVYPMGKYNKLVINEMISNGLSYGMTVLPFHISRSLNKKEIPRICINGYLSFNKFKLFISKFGNIYLHLAFIKRKILKQNYLDK